VTTEELEKIKKFDVFIEKIIAKIDPFTVDPLPLPFSQPSFPSPFPQESQDLYSEYITDPQKHKKSKLYPEFSECKKRFDLILNKEDAEQDLQLGSRFEVYSNAVSIPRAISQIVSFLEGVPGCTQAVERKKWLRQAEEIKNDDRGGHQVYINEPKIHAEISSFESPAGVALGVAEKLCLLRSLLKHLGDWDKVGKEFRDKPIPVETLKKIWRALKVTMQEEVSEIRKNAPTYHFVKWLRAAIRKLEINNGKKTKNKTSVSINPKPKEQRFDMLSIMAEVENSKCIGIESTTSLHATATSSFKVYANGGTLQELCN
jgi:hypothetical protein